MPVTRPSDRSIPNRSGASSAIVHTMQEFFGTDNIDKEVAKRIRATVKEQVLDGLNHAANFEVPRSLLDSEVARMQQAAVEDLKQRGMSTQDLQLPSEQVRGLIEQHAETFEHPDQLVRWYYSDPSRLAEVEALVMEDNVVEWALGNMKVVDSKMPFDDLMGTKKE